MRKNNTTFVRLVSLLDCKNFEKINDVYFGDYYTKAFNSWDHLMCLLYGVITSQSSLRMLEMNYNELMCISEPEFIRRSTLSDANSRRDPRIYINYFNSLVSRFLLKQTDRKEMNSLVKLIDSTPTMLLGRGHEWVEKTQRIKGLKVHVIYSLTEEIPTYFTISSAKVNDIVEAQKFDIEPGCTYIFDRAYYDFQWWARLNNAGCHFVTRAKSTLKYEWSKKFSGAVGKVKSDSLIKLTSEKGHAKYKDKLRMIKARIDVRGKMKTIILLTNCLTKTNEEIIDLYKKRWQIELFFKWLKQHLKIKKFYGENENAIKLQIIIAMIAYLLIHNLRMKLGIQCSMHRITHWIKYNLDKDITKSLLLKPPLMQTKEGLR